MALFAPWSDTDTYVAAIIGTILLLLVIFNRGKSFLADGVFVGYLIGSVFAFASGEETYGSKMGYGSAAVGLIKKNPGVQPLLEWFIAVTLTTGTGAI